MIKRLRIKLLIAIWGARYIHEFARISLPSYLAEGNIPHLASNADLEIVVMTTADSRAAFEDTPAFARLSVICPVRFILIDDLVTSGHYGVTLTLAFARGIRDSGRQQTDTHFLFLNSDFVLSDGSLASILRKLEAGSHCVLAPSLRARSEDVLAALEGRVDERGVLAIPSRDLVDLTLRSLHPTVIGKTVTQQLCTCRTHNQIYWQVDEKTLLGRYYLIFMLAIRPEVPMGPVNSYCDYGFIPELVPSGEFTMMDDSDEFFMLELQSGSQEKDLMRGGRSSRREIARQLAEWTTAEHRRFADVDVVFHARDIPVNLSVARHDFASWFERVRAELAGTPVTHVGHYYWTMGLQAWAASKHGDAMHYPRPPEVQASRDTSLPPDTLLAQLRSWLYDLHVAAIARAKRLLGTMPTVPIWSYQWLDGRLVTGWVKSVSRPKASRHLFLCGENSVLAPYFERRTDFEVDRTLAAHFDSEGAQSDPPSHPAGVYDSILIHICRADMLQTGRVLERVRRALKLTGRIAVYVDHKRGEFDPSNFSTELAQYAEHVMPPDWLAYQLGARFVGGRVKRWLRLAEMELFGYLVPSSRVRPTRVLAGVVLWPLVAATMAIYNFIHRNAPEECPDFCSSFMLTLTRAPCRSQVQPIASAGERWTVDTDPEPVA